MTIRAFACAALCALLSRAALCQPAPPAATLAQAAAQTPDQALNRTPAPPPLAFEAADVHVSPPIRFPYFNGAAINGSRYILHTATMADLVATAYGVDVTHVQGGPRWLERDRYEVIAKLPPNSTKPTQRQMLQALLADRFKLVIHNDSRPLPAYVLSVAKSGSKLKSAPDESVPATCNFKGGPGPAGAAFIVAFECKNTTMESLAEQLHDWNSESYLPQPVVDATGLKGGFDFAIRWTNRNDLAKPGSEGTIYEAVEKELGLKLDLLTAPRPVILVDSVSQKPTPNAPGIEKILPPPRLEFEVATIKPSDPAAKPNFRINVDGDQAKFENAPLRELVVLAWDLSPGDKEVPVNAPKWLESERFDILAKTPSEPGTKPSELNFDDLRVMLRALIIDRFQIKAHMEDRMVNSYQLIALSPRLKAADPAEHTVCKEGPGPDGKDPRLASPILNRLVTCQNMTMADIADELQRTANGYIYNPIVDKTGLAGGFDFTLSFSSIQFMGADAASSTSDKSSEPNGALSFFDAVQRQLGLKLEKQKRTLPVLVLDHIEEKPTDN